MKKQINKKYVKSIHIGVSIICICFIVLLVYSIINQNIRYRVSDNWNKVEIISENVKEEDIYSPSKYKGFHKQTRYQYIISYRINSKTEELIALSYTAQSNPIDIRINPNTQKIFIRREVGLWDYFIRLSVVFLLLLILLIFGQEIIKKHNKKQ